MGCSCSSPEHTVPVAENSEQKNRNKPARKVSWRQIRTDFCIEGLKGETVCRKPGTVEGKQFTIENCEDSNVYIYDYSSAVSVENCTNCRIFLGPVKGNVYLRGCKDCVVGIACLQLKIKNCSKLDLFLLCATSTIIESSSGLTFSCLQYYYSTLKDQFHFAQLSVYNNNWGRVSDNSARKSSSNFRIINENIRVDLLVPSSMTVSKELDINSDPDRTVVPFTPGIRQAPKDKSCLVVFFSDGLSHDRAHAFIKRMKEFHPECSLVQSREVVMQEEDAEKILGSKSYAMAIKQGPVIGLEYSGNKCCQVCQDSLITVSKGSTGLVFVSSTSETASKQVESFYRFAETRLHHRIPQRVGSVRR